MTDKKIAISAIEVVIRLNEDAGKTNELLTGVMEQIQKVEDSFSSELIGNIRPCFKHFQKVRPHLTKVRAHEEFHLLRLRTLPLIWKSFLTRQNLPPVDVLDIQSVNRIIFDSMMKELLLSYQPQVNDTPEKLI